eukprot:12099246-Alexandrium_andersonii.AAC.1
MKALKCCCEAHLEKARGMSTAVAPRGPRAEVSSEQFVLFFQTAVSEGVPWLAGLSLVQVCLGERASCAAAAQFGWFIGLGSSNPVIEVPKVNGKTKPRTVPIHPDVGRLLHGWMHSEPLSGKGEQWPFNEQPQGLADYLFPGLH